MLDALTLDQMRVFVAVADAGSFRAGAEQLLRAQSAVSHSVAKLEAVLGVPLFDRSVYRPVLTPEGKTLLEDVRAVLLRVDRMRARVRGFEAGVELELSIVVDSLFPLPVAATALHSLRRDFPAVAVSLAIAPLGEPVAAVYEGRADLGIAVSDTFRDPRVEFEALSSLSFVAVAAPDHPLAGSAVLKGTIGNAELAEHLQIVLIDPSELSRGRDFGVLSSHTWRVGTQEAKRALIMAGVGWGRLPHWAVRRELDDGTLVRIPAESLGKAGETLETAFLAHRTDRPFGPAARALRDALSVASAHWSALCTCAVTNTRRTGE